MGLGNPSVAIWQLTECFKVRALVVYVMQLNREHFRSIIFYNGVDELNNSKSIQAPSSTSVYWWYDEFNRSRSSLHHIFPENSQKQFLFRKPLMLCANCYCKIVMSCQKNLFALDPTQFVDRSENDSCRMVEKMLQKYDRSALKHI